MLRRDFLTTACVGAASVVGAGACSSAGLVAVGGGRVAAAEIDKDPFALLPGGVVVFGALDARALFATQLGADVAGLVSSLVPLGAESNFSPVRDVSRVLGGVYAMQGVDFCAVVRGNFDVSAISAAAAKQATVPSGAPLVRTQYGPYELFTVGNLGFVLLTQQTLLSGNEIGMRRALDRLRFNRLGRSLQPWMIELSETTGLVFGAAGDFGAESAMSVGPNGLLVSAPRATSAAQPVLEAASKNFPFLSELRAMRVLGNFQAPGVNLVGALTYTTPERAENGAIALKNLSQMAQFAGLLSSFGLGSGLAPAQIAVSGSDVGFAQPVDLSFARMALNMLGGSVRR
jgi:hypothetical protein